MVQRSKVVVEAAAAREILTGHEEQARAAAVIAQYKAARVSGPLKPHIRVKQLVLTSGVVHWGIMGTAITGDSTDHVVWGLWSKVNRYLRLDSNDTVRQALAGAIVFKNRSAYGGAVERVIAKMESQRKK